MVMDLFADTAIGVSKVVRASAHDSAIGHEDEVDSEIDDLIMNIAAGDADGSRLMEAVVTALLPLL